MKAEINSENKGKFFSLYWFQEILSDGKELGWVCGDFDEELFLRLKPLSSITEKNMIDIARICNIEKEAIDSGLNPNWKDGLVDSIQEEIDDFAFPFQVVDYLRSEGYLLPWMGLSPDEIIEAGWVKYKE